MPAQAPKLDSAAAATLGALGARIRERRKALRVSATTAAEAAGMSRVTLHRIEQGGASVTMGAYANAMAALGVQIQFVDVPQPAGSALDPVTSAGGEAVAPQRIRLADYPQLKQLAWHVPGATDLTPEEALSLYERNWRHVEQGKVEARERALIDTLVRTLGKGHLLV
ncbi:helix-turn-helix domain-containing protein [Variovorax fucosicus]|uniref:helix-turn-helix domain-containing protein n=1 Tax=Variovorax fucosicus TaxID=3053517 RepID=UPI002578F069|nr:helix-turn-helix transcriptional regulator [Variovorax sp. J22G47]MDM0057964.1 helix-turn-helix transcriptional regulator [Variovorax sp. J22G47]